MIARTNKEIYIGFCEKCADQLPVFYQPWWLDKVCVDGQWDVALSLDGESKVIGCLPYYITRKFGQKIISMPPLTPFAGILTFIDEDLKEVNKSKKEQKIIENLIQQLPQNITYFTQSFYYSFANWLPFFWKSYCQTTRYSYVIHNIKAWTPDNAAANVRNKINQAGKELQYREIDDPAVIYHLVNKGLKAKKIKIPLSLDGFMSFDQILSGKNQRKMLVAYDQNNQIHAGIYLVYDHLSVYNILLGSDPDLRKSGAVPFLLSKAIKASSSVVDRFDFEGSMLNSVNDLFAGFGSERVPYFRIFKFKNIFWELVYNIKNRNDKNNR